MLFSGNGWLSKVICQLLRGAFKRLMQCVSQVPCVLKNGTGRIFEMLGCQWQSLTDFWLNFVGKIDFC